MGHTLIAGDSNALQFHWMPEEAGYERWLPHPDNPASIVGRAVPRKLVVMRFTHAEDASRTIEVAAHMGASILGLGRAGDAARDVLARIAAVPEAIPIEAVLLFGQADLDFVLFHRLAREDVDPFEFVRGLTASYMEFLERLARPRLSLTVVGAHPPMVTDGALLAFLERWQLTPTRLGCHDFASLARAFPAAARSERLRLRRLHHALLAEACAARGYGFIDPMAMFCDAADPDEVPPRFRHADPIDVHVNHRVALPVWLARLPALAPGRRPDVP